MAALGQPLRSPWPLRGGAAGVLTLAPALAAAAALWLTQLPAGRSPLLVLVAAAALATVVWALVDLEHFLLVVVLAAMSFPHALLQPAGALIAAADLLMLVALGAWLAQRAVGRVPGAFLAGNPLLAPGLCFTGAMLASFAWSSDRFATAKMTVQIFEIVVVGALAYASLPRSLQTIRRGFTAYVAVTSALAAVASVTFAGQVARDDFSPVYIAGLHKNALGSFLGVGLVLAFALSLDRGRSGRFRFWMRLAAGLEFAGLIATVSRGAALGTLVAALIVSLALRRERLRTFALIALAATALMAVVTRAHDRPDVVGGYSSSSVRNLSWADGVEKIRDHPVLGTGAGTYWSELEEIHIGLADPNNLFLLTWAELGLVGVAALLFLLWRFSKTFHSARRLPEQARVLALAAGGGSLSLLVHFQFDVTWTRGVASLCFALMGVMVATLRLGSAGVGAPTAAPPAARRPASPARAERSRPRPALRVLHLLSSDGYAGIERHVVRLARGLREAGIACEIGCPPSAERVRAEARTAGVRVVPAADEVKRGAWLPRLVERLTDDPPDVVHVHDGTAAVWGWQVASLTRARFVRTQHFVRPASTSRGGWRRRGSLALHRSLNADVDALVAVSDAVASSVRDRREARTEVVTVIPPGIELPTAARVERAVAMRPRLSHPVVAYVGRFEAEKGLALLLEAIPLVLARVPECRFALTGSGSVETELRAQARRLQVEHAIDWIGSVADSGAVLTNAHVYVNPTPAEAFGLATAEAMSFALPVVAQRSGASVELVEDGVTGLLVDRLDPAELADAIAQLAADRQRAARMGQAGRRRAVDRFGVDRTVSLTLSLYEELARR